MGQDCRGGAEGATAPPRLLPGVEKRGGSILCGLGRRCAGSVGNAESLPWERSVGHAHLQQLPTGSAHLQRLSWPGLPRNSHDEHLLRRWLDRSHCNWGRHCRWRRHGGHEGRPLRLALPAAETAESTDAAYHHRTDHYNGYDGPGHASGAAAGVVAAMSSTARTILTIRTGTFTVVAPSCAAGSVLALSRLTRAISAPASSA